MGRVAVAFKRPLPRFYSYEAIDPEAAHWRRVEVELGSRKAIGFCLPEKYCGEEAGFALKPVLGVLDPLPLLGPASAELALWIADYFHSGPGEALSLFFPFGDYRQARTPRKKKEAALSLPPLEEPLALNGEQEAAVGQILAAKGKAPISLIHGVTGSGKTWVYAELIRRVMMAGKQAILALPEIALTPQLEGFFRERFGDRLAVIHSRVPDARKYADWLRIARGEASLVLGARSAIFAPLCEPGLICLDEEHEATYKNNQVPRYHARTVAQVRCARAGIPLVLGSATPSLEARWQADQGRIELVRLQKRYFTAGLPVSELVAPAGIPGMLLPEPVVREIARRKGLGEQVLVYLNKRGYASGRRCGACGWIQGCPRCSVSLTWHKSRRRSECHFCGHAEAVVDACPRCGSAPLLEAGYGTERIEEEFGKRLPGVRVGRLDSDRLRKEKDGWAVLESFRAGELDVLVGTQMLTKGHDFPKVNLVVVLFPENLLVFPDFRASERTFSQITQVSGRSGRRGQEGAVMIVSAWGDQPAIEWGRRQDYEAFYEAEREVRRRFDWPPFAKMMRLVVRGPSQPAVKAAASKIGEELEKRLGDAATRLGPAPCLLERVKNHWRHQIVLKIKDEKAFRAGMRAFRESVKVRPPLYLEYDMDPMDML